MMLKDKVAVVYGAGGAIGGAVARAFAAEGATVFVTGHRRESVDAVAREIVAAGGAVEAATIDALDEQAVDQHLRYVVDRAGRLDNVHELKTPGISFEQFQGALANDNHARRIMTLSEVADVAALVASNRAGALTGTTVNLTMGGAAD